MSTEMKRTLTASADDMIKEEKKPSISDSPTPQYNTETPYLVLREAYLASKRK